MSIADLADILAHQFATPAPTAGDPPTRPGDGPWKPGGPSQRPTTDELVVAARQTVIDLNAAVARSRRARGADLGEVA